MLTGPVLATPTLPEPVTATLQFRPPLDARSLLDFLRLRAVMGIERVRDDIYARTLRLPHGPASFRLQVRPERVEARVWVTDAADLGTAVERCRHLLDLDADPTEIDGHLGNDPHLAHSVAAHPGLRVPGHVDGFEVAVRAVVGQQISVAGARTVLGRLVAEYGEPHHGSEGLTHLFPGADRLSTADPERLPMPRSRGRALIALAGAVQSAELALDRSADRTQARRTLLALPGIGPWTADYIALRALGDPDVFMGTDLGVRQGLARLGIADAGPDVVRAWAPWRSYALMHVWKSLDEEPR
jgi:AraC family transcriptional regulator of adaptative response / DNA-3-methyladenine glycosylase II